MSLSGRTFDIWQYLEMGGEGETISMQYVKIGFCLTPYRARANSPPESIS